MVEDGDMEPLPTWVSQWRVARWMGVTIGELQRMPYWEVLQATILMAAEQTAERNAHKRKQEEHGGALG